MSEPPAKLYQTRHGPMMAMRRDSYITRCLEAYGEISPDELDLLSQLVTPGTVVIEAGANIGVFTVPLARRCFPGALYAFEPQQRIFQLLCANLALNGVRNVVASREACGAADGRAVVPPIDYGAEGNFGGVALEAAGAKGDEVRVIPLDSLGLTACGLLKIDVEGFERQVLAGAVGTIRRCRPIIYMENNQREQQAALIETVHGLGYRLYWHTPPLVDTADSIFGRWVVSQNMLCMPSEHAARVDGLAPIEPGNWRSPLDRD